MKKLEYLPTEPYKHINQSRMDRSLKTLFFASFILYILLISPLRIFYFGIFSIIILITIYRIISRIPSHLVYTQVIIFLCFLIPELFFYFRTPQEPSKYYLQDGTVKYKVLQEKQGLFSGNLIDFSTLRYAQPRFCRFVIDQYGYRNSSTKPDEAQILTIGDSYTFGMVTQDQIWPEQLKVKSGLKVYNLGITNYCPEQAVQTLENFLQEHQRPDSLRTVILMLFHGNDLSDKLRSDWQQFYQQNRSPLIYLGNYIGEKKSCSILNQLFTSLVLKQGKQGSILAIQNYYGETALMSKALMEEAGQSLKNIITHPHFSSIQKALIRFKQLANRYHFYALVAMAPSKELVLSEKWGQPLNHSEFNKYFSHYCDSIALPNFDLSQDFIHTSRTQRLYLPDDTHWDENGNHLTAELLALRVR